MTTNEALALSEPRPSSAGHAVSEVGSFEQPGTLSIVIQGGLFEGNLVEVANHCQHWRWLFPNAQIILSLSVADALITTIDPAGRLTRVRLLPRLRHNGILQAALRAILAACDLLLKAPDALPLPPLKAAPAINNGNLQIAAARAGLAHATGLYTLRIRSDAVFIDKGFLEYYLENVRLPRQSWQMLSQRVLISELFTLNPYTLERLPFHYSDWFHFGLTEDVKRLWEVSPIQLSDAVHYRIAEYSPHTNVLERQFHARRAVEQHIATHALSKLSPGISLAYHNATEAAETSMCVLLDNFIVADMRRCSVYLDKYMWNMKLELVQTLCVTSDDWRELATSGRRDFLSFFDRKIRDGRKRLLIQQEPAAKLLVKALRLHRANMDRLRSFGRLIAGAVSLRRL